MAISLTWQGLEINNAEPENCAAGSTNWFLLLEVLLLSGGTLQEYCFGNRILKYFCFIRVGLKISELSQDDVSTCLLMIWVFISVL